jgi:TPR repeat protein/tRNA A-37 threonylcarbamoyl transferase component Bud32
MPEAEQYQQYEVLRREDGSLWELGRGAMGITYKAYDTNLHCTVALKVINSTYLQNDTARQRFLREARAAAALRHPNVASVFNLSTDQDNYFYVMEFIDGETVEDCVKRKGRLEPVEALNITLQVARALGAAAKQRLVHRDLKPSNLMLVDQEGEQIVKVIDFGLAKSAKDAGEDTGTLTMDGFVGTPHFASPEQVEEGDLDVRSDIYSLGATLYFMIAGKAPFSGSVGQVMSQHLYKPIDIEPLTGVPSCVVSLIRSMLEKDRNQRPQTPRDLQNAIVACLEEIRGHSTRVAQEAVDEPSQSLAPRTLLARNYRLIEELRESPEGRHFLAEDIRGKRLVRVMILRHELVSDSHWFAALHAAIEGLRKAPYPMLRAIYSSERADGYSILVEEHSVGPSLLDLLRSRSVLSAPEVVRLLNLLAPLADHASAHQLEYVDFTLQGIHFVNTGSTASEIQPDLLRQSLTTWEHLEAKVNAIDFSFAISQAGTLTGMETRMQGAADGGPRDSYVRSLSLLAYELLGGPRARVEATGRYNPIAALTRDGNAVLRRGLIDEYSSAAELAGQLAAAAGIRKSAAPISERRAPVAASTEHVISSTEPVAPEPFHQTVSPEASAEVLSKRPFMMSAWQWVLVIGLIASVGIGGYLIYLRINQSQGIVAPSQEFATLSVQSDPPGASILLDGKPSSGPSNTFAHVPFGTHQLTATLNDYEPVKQDIEIRRGMAPEIHLKLKPSQEIAALSVQSDPPGASILLDGKPSQGPSNTFSHVPFGTHQLTATLNDYEPIKQDLEVRRGMAPEIHLKLKQSQDIAALSVQSDPRGAAILLDGKPPSGPSNSFAHVPFGTHQLTATLNDYESIKQDIEVRRGMAPEIRLKFNKKADPLAELVAETKKYDQSSPQYLSAYVRLVQFVTTAKAANSKEYTDELGRIIEQLRTKAPPIGKNEFSLSFKESIMDAANLDILPAILWLAENEKGSEAVNLFLRAANLGDSYAMMRTGRFYLNKGTPSDDDTAFGWLKRAYEAPNSNLEAGAYLGACYLSGRGTKKDVQKAEEILIPLANRNVVSAMTIAGNLLEYRAADKQKEAEQSTTPPKRKQPLYAEVDELDRQARKWYERAAAKGDWNASARLGRFYENGWGGLEKSDEEAEKRYQDGTKQANPLSMFFYGQFLLQRKPERRSEAETLMSQAASAGVPSAIKWCKENNVTFTEATPEDER